MAALQMIIPKGMKTIEEEANQRYFSPLTRRLQKLFGGKETEYPKNMYRDYDDASVLDVDKKYDRGDDNKREVIEKKNEACAERDKEA